MDKFIFEIPNAISKELCQEMIERFENDDRKCVGTIHIQGKNIEKSDIKKSIDLDFSSLKEWSDIDKKIKSSVINGINTYFKYIKEEFDYEQSIHPIPLIFNIETSDHGYEIQKQSKNCEYKWHYDGSTHDIRQGQSFLNVLIYLNSLNYEEGGCTKFINGRRIVPEIGKMLIFPCGWTYIHSGEKIKTDKPKYTCVTTIYPREKPNYQCMTYPQQKRRNL